VTKAQLFEQTPPDFPEPHTMADTELAAIRQARLAQMQQSTPSSDAQPSEERDKQQAEEQMRRDLLATVLDSAARERLSRIALVSPQRSAQIEAILLRMAQSGQLRGRVTEESLIGLLQQADDAQAKTSAKKATIVYQRRRDFDDDEDDELDI